MKPAKENMPKWGSHKKVRALRIKSVTLLSETAGGGAHLTFENELFDVAKVTPGYISKYGVDGADSLAGGYYIIHKSGRKSWRSEKSFRDEFVGQWAKAASSSTNVWGGGHIISVPYHPSGVGPQPGGFTPRNEAQRQGEDPEEKTEGPAKQWAGGMVKRAAKFVLGLEIKEDEEDEEK